MSNPIIDAITWDPNDTAASAALIQTQLTSLYAEWQTKLSRNLQITSSSIIADSTWSAKKDETSPAVTEKDAFVGFNPVNQKVEEKLRYIKDAIVEESAINSLGKIERYNAPLTTRSLSGQNLISQVVSLKRPAFIKGVHPLIITSVGANPTTAFIVPTINGTPIYSGSPTGGASGDPRPGFLYFPLSALNTIYHTLTWSTNAAIPVGTYTITLTLYLATFLPGAVSNPFSVGGYNSPLPQASYLEVIYQ